jgi:hypothetical protein
MDQISLLNCDMHVLICAPYGLEKGESLFDEIANKYYTYNKQWSISEVLQF